ncbi:MAG: hypothetical protein J0I07_03200 [Myxococcales bacterium]|nr:hypothetical protein [Myxococcales bacterium]
MDLRNTLVPALPAPSRCAWTLAAFAVLLAGCAGAMSESAFDRLAAEVGERNERRHLQAVEELGKRGYTLVGPDEEARFATLEEPAHIRCQDAVRGVDRLDAGALPHDAPLRIEIGEATRGGEPPKPPVYVVARAGEACAFFRRREVGSALDVTKGDGQAGRLVLASPRLMARGGNGELVVVEIRPKIVKSRTVLVKRTCNHMPSVPRDPLETAFGVPVRWTTAPAHSTVVMTVEREDLHMECTDHVY